jgi:divalent metal cation (Fe/Co/Zn/Cd) transporter
MVVDSAVQSRQNHVRLGRRPEYFTLAWNSVEALVFIIAGLIAGSISLVGFGIDSTIEIASGGVLWRLHHDFGHARREQIERTTLRIVGWCFVALAVYILYESVSTLIRHEVPETSGASFRVNIRSECLPWRYSTHKCRQNLLSC